MAGVIGLDYIGMNSCHEFITQSRTLTVKSSTMLLRGVWAILQLDGLGEAGIGLSRGTVVGSSGTYEISELDSEMSVESAAVVGRKRDAMMTL